MNFWQIFIRVLWRRPLPALLALWWFMTRRKVRARNGLRAAGAPLSFAYKFWIRNVECRSQTAEQRSAVIKSWESKPTFTVIINAIGCPWADLQKSLNSIEQQTYRECSVIVVGADLQISRLGSSSQQTASSLLTALRESTGEFIVPLAAGDQLAKSALFNFSMALQSAPSAAVLYGDEDEIDDAGTRRRPWFKPQWNEELFLARDYISRACSIRGAAVRRRLGSIELNAETWAFDILLAVIEADAGPVVHLPKIVAHVANVDAQPDQHARVEAVRRYVEPFGAVARAGSFESVKVSWPLPNPLPLVSIIVPTRDNLEVLRPCIETVLRRTHYEPFELIIVDNASEQPSTHRYLRELRANSRVRILPHPHRYNYSAINNRAAQLAKGDFLCLLNNDTEVIEGDWLTEMMRYAVREQVGAVGAKLLYPDGTIQHAGVVVGIGDAAGHPHRFTRSTERGYFCCAHMPQYMSAVTGACLVVNKRKFLAVGGLDEHELPIAYNDIDLCLKLQGAGWRNVYVPHSVLLHHESKSRLRDHAPTRIEAYRRELKTFQERWGTKHYKDPVFNPNLDRSSETFLICF